MRNPHFTNIAVTVLIPLVDGYGAFAFKDVPYPPPHEILFGFVVSMRWATSILFGNIVMRCLEYHPFNFAE